MNILKVNGIDLAYDSYGNETIADGIERTARRNG